MVAVSLAEGIEPGGERMLDIETTEGTFVEWVDEDAIYRGQIEYVMREGTFGIEGGEYSLTATPDDPIALVRKWSYDENGYWEATEELVGKRFSELTAIEPPMVEAIVPYNQTSVLSEPGDEIRRSLPEVEKRNFHQEFEVRELPDGGFQFSGYAAVFNSDSEPLPFIERILPGAFDKTLKSRNNVKMYLNHDSTLVLGATRSKTLRLSTDTVGLYTEADLPNTSYARDLAEVMMRGDVDSMSFGFSVPRNGDTWSADGMRRELREIRLHEVSVVTGFPAYSATSASLRSIDALASTVGLDADKLAEALTVLENGKELSDEHASMLSEAVSKLRADKKQDNLLAVKMKHLELLKQQF
jgi:HK97 family phage prohead protease